MFTLSVEEFLNDLKEIVSIESNSKDPAGTTEVASWLRDKFTALGYEVQWTSIGDEVGPCLFITPDASIDSYDILFVGHMDTVFARGTLAERPFKVEGNRAYGPGVIDMKSGLLSIYHVCKALAAEGKVQSTRIAMCFNPDEEISSTASRPVIEACARKAKRVVVLEPARANGDFVCARKGIAKYEIEFFGKASHAATDPDKGANAINAFIYAGRDIISWADKEKGTLINIGTIAGGTTPNTVPAYVKIVVDVRVATMAEAERIQGLMTGLSETEWVRGVKVQVTGGLKRPPMTQTEESQAFCKDVDVLAKECGLTPTWQTAAGGSDGNFTAALGIPTIDAMGPRGGGAHSDAEYLELDDVKERVALIYRIVEHYSNK